MMRARTQLRSRRLLLLAGVLAVAGCADITQVEAELTPAILSGDWEVTTAQITSILNTNRTFDLLAEGGELEFRFTIAGDASIFVTPPDGETVVDTGTYEIVGDYLYFYDEADVDRESPDIFAYELQSTQTGNSLTLATTDLTWDFEGDGTADSAFFAIVMIR
jgi:hypothetical protein